MDLQCYLDGKAHAVGTPLPQSNGNGSTEYAILGSPVRKTGFGPEMPPSWIKQGVGVGNFVEAARVAVIFVRE